METNKELELVWNFVNNTDRNIFLQEKQEQVKLLFYIN